MICPSCGSTGSRCTCGGQDPVAASLASALQDNGLPHAVRAAAQADLAELTDLAEICARLPIAELGVDAPAHHYDLVPRYVRLLVRISCLQLWRHSDGGFLADPAWLHEPVEDVLLAELFSRHRDHCYFGLSGRSLV